MTTILQPVAMVRPTRECIYAPSRLHDPITITAADRWRIENGPQLAMLVSFEKDGISNPQRVTAYGWGWDCWYIIRERDNLLDRAFRLAAQIKRLPGTVLAPLLESGKELPE